MSLQSRYTILRKITDGGTAEIFLAKQHGAHGFEKAVVLKRIFPAFYADPQFRHMLVDEAHIAMTLNHSNIVQVLDLGEVDGRYFLALELVDGWTLDRTLKRAQAAGVPFAPALALYVTAEVCRALAYAHAKVRDGKHLGIVHRDISPHNVLLSNEGEVKLTDFGIAKAQNRKEKSLGNMIKGKISFMSPEQASGADIDARSDLFSLGTMLYAMITRRLPFDASTDYETLMLVKSGDYLPPETARPGLNPELYRVIRKAMSKSAADRYQKAEEMLVDVEQVMRLAFRPVGQTELQRWLADLSTKDGVPPLTRDAAPPPGTATATESGVVLDLDDAIEIQAAPTSGRPAPPPPAPTEVMLHPPDMGADNPRSGGTNISLAVIPWWKRHPRATLGGVALLLMLIVGAKAFTGGKRTPGEPAAPAPVVAEATPPPPAPPPAAEPPPPPPVVEAPPVKAEEPPKAPAAAEKLEPPAQAEAPKEEPKKIEQAEKPEKAEEPKKAAAREEPKPEKDSKAADADDAKAKKAATPATVTVTFRTEPEGARMTGPNRVFGTTPEVVKLASGSAHELTFTKAGYAPASKRYVVPSAGKGPQTVKISLKKLPEPKKVAPPPPSAPKDKKGWFSR
jgi:serine/threonine-protein kinase